KNKAALKKFKKGSLERTRVAKQTALLLTKYKHANNRKLASEKLLIAIERKHEITYMQLTLGIGKMEHVLDRLPKN
ncbi:hypothetical protein K0U07_02675, partial [bacterium]|nr:hypothetical protein [bacterium]